MKRVYTMAWAVSLSLAALLFVWGMLTTLPAQAAPPARPLLQLGNCVVTSTLDSGAGSLRQCMLGLQAGATITFSTTVFPPGSPVTITLSSGLPAIVTDSVIIDASNAGVILDGSGASDAQGLVINGADHVTIKGLRILNFPQNGIFLYNGASYNTIGGTNATPGGACSGDCNLISGNGNAGIFIGDTGTMSNTISGNYIGTNVNGTVAVSNSDSGVNIRGGAQNNIITNNLISGNGRHGVSIADIGTVSNTVSGNTIGTDANGTTTLSNGNCGVAVGNGASNNHIGGDMAGERNLISGNLAAGVSFDDSGTMSNTVSGNYIGTDTNGTTALGNNGGVWIGTGASYNLIGGVNASPGGSCTGECNLISGGGSDGVSIQDSAISNTVAGNYIGTAVNGASALGNGGNGISIDNGASNNIIGGPTAGERNLISGNNEVGVSLRAGGNVIQNNYIGTDVTGSNALGNGVVFDYTGVDIDSANNLIKNNLVSGNRGNGITIAGNNSTGNVVQGNTIGTDVSGTTTLGNRDSGILVNVSASNNLIGGDTAGERNLISGNGIGGVDIYNSNTMSNTISGNYIGTDVTGMGAISNHRCGISVLDGARGNTIGPGNLIAYNSNTGVCVGWWSVVAPLNNKITQNSIYSNTYQGIDLAEGGNLELFPPILTDVTTHTVEGLAPPHSTVEIFSDAEDEGRYYHGFTMANASGNFTFTQTSAFTGVNVTATATDGDGNTSEFSAAYMPLVDVQVIAILQPKKGYGKIGQTVTPTVKIGNAGTSAEIVAVSVTATGAGGLNYTASQANIGLPPLGYATLTFDPFTIGGAYYFTATVTLASDQDAGNNVESMGVNVASDVIDLWTRDNSTDNGDIPTSSFWQSPDLWVRNADDNGLVHQNPLSGTTNYVYMLVRNRGTAQAGTGNTAKVYWHEPSLGIKCGDWAQIDAAKPISTTLLNPTTQLLKFSWTPTRTGHTCLHGEINSTADPIMNPCDIPWDNNLSQRNVDIIPGGVSGQGIEAQAAGGIVFEVTNIKDKPKPVDLIVDVSQVAGVKTVRLDLGHSLADRWAGVNGLTKSSGIAWTGGAIITITNPMSGTIAGIPMSGGETQNVTLLVNAPAVVTAAVTVYEAIDAGPGVAQVDAIVGGNTYVFNSEMSSVYLPIILKNR